MDAEGDSFVITIFASLTHGNLTLDGSRWPGWSATLNEFGSLGSIDHDPLERFVGFGRTTAVLADVHSILLLL